MSNLSKIKSKLRTQGRVTGNFGRNKVEGKRQILELSKEVLSKEGLRIPSRQEVYSRLQDAYNITTDPSLKKFILSELKKRDVQRSRPKVLTCEVRSEFWEEVRRVR